LLGWVDAKEAVEWLCKIAVVVAVGQPERAAFLIARAAAETEEEMLSRMAEQAECPHYRFRVPELPRPLFSIIALVYRRLSTYYWITVGQYTHA
jgi:hypothetical protein